MAYYRCIGGNGGGGETKSVSYLKWQILKTRDVPSAGCMQLSEFIVYQNGVSYSWNSNASITSDMVGVSGETVDKLIDNNINTKYNTQAWGNVQTNTCNIVISLGETITLDRLSSYGYVTANDEPSRDPISWKLYGSTDGINWELLDERNDATLYTERHSLTPSYPMSYVSGGSPVQRITYKNYAKFDIEGIVLDIAQNTDYKITCEFYDTKLSNTVTSVLGLTGSTSVSTINLSIKDASNYGIGTGKGSGSNATISGRTLGDHVIVINDGSNQSVLDGTITTTFTPTTLSGRTYTVGCHSNSINLVWSGYIKSYKLESLSTGNKICELKPAVLYEEFPCLYDSVNDKVYMPDGLTVMDTLPT